MVVVVLCGVGRKPTLEVSILPEAGRDVGGIHILSPETSLSSNHKLLLLVSAWGQR